MLSHCSFEVVVLGAATAKPELLYPEVISSNGFFLSGVPNERSLLVGVEVKATAQTLKQGILAPVLL
jgi:hypothetical protein